MFESSAGSASTEAGQGGVESGQETNTGAYDGTGNEGSTADSTWCIDADQDGFGDPDNCLPEDPGDGSAVPNGDDCDDTNENTFPGAAPNDDPEACMQDADGDDWGDDDPPAGVEPGSDCSDTDVNIFPGAAENEMPADLCAQDADGDGWGDSDPPDGVEPGSDCADDDVEIFPGAAEMEMPPDLCAQDSDGDGWGDDNPPPGVDPGSDCDDDNPAAFPGAAPSEDPPDLCTVDADGDGWGDAGSGGSDCYDGNPDLNPDELTLTAFFPYSGGPVGPLVSRTIAEIDPATAFLTPFVTLQDPMGSTMLDQIIVTASMDENGEVIASDRESSSLYSVDYETTCLMGSGEIAPFPMPYDLGDPGDPGDFVCGLEWGPGGMLFVINHGNQVLTFDPMTGDIDPMGVYPIVDGAGDPLNIFSCGMAYDCATDTLLVANAADQSIYRIEIMGTDAVATTVLDLSMDPVVGMWPGPTGMEYNPQGNRAWLSTGSDLIEVDLDGVDPSVLIGSFTDGIVADVPVSNLQYLPICM